MSVRKNLSAVLFVFVIGVQQLSGQGNDTSIFFRYAATFDQLIPGQYHPANALVPDTSSLEIFNFAPMGMSLEKRMSRTTRSDRGESTENLGFTSYTWDKEGRVVNYREYWPGDSAAHLNIRFRFLIRQNMSEIITTSGSNIDTTSFQYNRSGWVGTWRRHALNVDTTFLITGTRMYDSRGKLIVLTNSTYGPLAGSYTFEYDRDGRLIRRCFLSGGSGIVLCTDTVEYAYQSESKSIVVMTHRLKITGMEKWATLETRTMYPYSGLIISCSDYNDADTNYVYRNLPSYTLQYEYDNKSRVTTENFGTEIEPAMITAKYYYGNQFQPDSIVYSERFTEKKQTITRVYSRDVRSYDSKNRLAERVITTYFFEEKKKKDTMVPVETVTIAYVWKNLP